MHILLDIDGVICNFVRGWLDVHEARTGERPSFVQPDFSDIEGYAETWDEVRSLEGFCASLDEYPGALDFLRDLRRRHDVLAVTKPMAGSPYWMPERWEWLKGVGFDDEEIIITGAKYQVWGDILIDDTPDHVRAAWGRGLLFDQPWNRGEAGQGLERVGSYQQILDLLGS